jgi:hypothetical protein
VENGAKIQLNYSPKHNSLINLIESKKTPNPKTVHQL